MKNLSKKAFLGAAILVALIMNLNPTRALAQGGKIVSREITPALASEIEATHDLVNETEYVFVNKDGKVEFKDCGEGEIQPDPNYPPNSGVEVCLPPPGIGDTPVVIEEAEATLPKPKPIAADTTPTPAPTQEAKPEPAPEAASEPQAEPEPSAPAENPEPAPAELTTEQLEMGMLECGPQSLDFFDLALQSFIDKKREVIEAGREGTLQRTIKGGRQVVGDALDSMSKGYTDLLPEGEMGSLEPRASVVLECLIGYFQQTGKSHESALDFVKKYKEPSLKPIEDIKSPFLRTIVAYGKKLTIERKYRDLFGFTANSAALYLARGQGDQGQVKSLQSQIAILEADVQTVAKERDQARRARDNAEATIAKAKRELPEDLRENNAELESNVANLRQRAESGFGGSIPKWTFLFNTSLPAVAGDLDAPTISANAEDAFCLKGAAGRRLGDMPLFVTGGIEWCRKVIDVVDFQTPGAPPPSSPKVSDVNFKAGLRTQRNLFNIGSFPLGVYAEGSVGISTSAKLVGDLGGGISLELMKMQNNPVSLELGASGRIDSYDGNVGSNKKASGTYMSGALTVGFRVDFDTTQQ